MEPRFELPVPPGPNLVTATGLGQIEARVAELEALDAASDDQKRDLRYWRKRLASAQLMPSPPADEVAFGSRVTFLLQGRERMVTIVGDDEAEPTAGLLALSAPLSQALLGAAEGEMLPFGGKPDAIEVLRIG
jgi:transcription elongation GreA/GreB family factor